MSAQSLLKFYEESKERVRRAGFDEAQAKEAYSPFVNYVDSFCGLKDKKTLDVGCGNGWSSWMLAQKGACVTGLDLHASSFEPQQKAQHLEYFQGSATKLKFENESFDLVVTHECLEHVADPVAALTEFDRVLKCGGAICIVGPNLLSLMQSYRGLTQYLWDGRPYRDIFFRHSQMPRHPHGNTVWEVIGRLFIHCFWILKLYLYRKPLTKMREPDVRPPFHADNDACYYLNPLDLKYHFTKMGYEIINYSGRGRPSWMAMVASGTWFCARKPDRSQSKAM